MDALASLISMGVALIVGLLVGFFRGKKKPAAPAFDTSKLDAVEAEVEAVVEAREEAQEKITEAAESTTPAADLAALGNKRKR